MACLLKPEKTCRDKRLVISRANCSAIGKISSGRSRNGGTAITSNASRSSRSARNLPCAARCLRFSLVTPITRTSTSMTSLPPTRSISPYSTTRSNFSCTTGLAVAISSKMMLPPSARSNRPVWRLVAPVKAPASWPNSSVSSRVSLSAAQLTLTSGPPQRAER